MTIAHRIRALSPLALALGVLAVGCLAQGPTWSSPLLRPTPRSGHSATFDPGFGRMLVFGGVDPGGNHLADTLEFDGSGWIRRQSLQSPPPRTKAAMAYDPVARRVLLYGGNPQSGPTWTDTWAWDGSAWTQLGPVTIPPASSWSAMVHHGGTNPGLLLLTNEGGLMKTWRWSGTNWLLVANGGLPARSDAAVAYVGQTSRTYVHGGIGRGDMYAWDGTNWTVVGQTPSTGPIGAHGMAWNGAALVLAGGGDFSGYNNLTFHGTFPSPGQVNWTYGSNFVTGINDNRPSSREYATLVWDSERQNTLLFGGTGSFATYDDLYERTVQGWSEVLPVAPQPPGRLYADMTYDAFTGDVVLFGGSDGTNTLGDTWTRDAVGWRFAGNNLGASPRVLPALAYRSGNGTVMFGGASAVGSGFLDDTLTWNGNTWTTMFSFNRPAARYGHRMVHDSARNRIVMFGGYGGSYRNDTWEFGSSGWVQMTTNGSPPPRATFGMAFDRRRNRTVLFGGQSATGGSLGDTWEYDGATSTWTQRAPVQAPPPRWAHSMDHDHARGVVVLMGGFANGLHLDEVWEYDGDTWRERLPASSLPGTREAAAMAYDPRTACMVVHGGGSYTAGPYVYRGDTWFYSADVDRLAVSSPNAAAIRVSNAATENGTFALDFPCASGFGWVIFQFGQDLVGQPVPAQYACTPATAFGLSGQVVFAPGSPAQLSFFLPAGLAGLGFMCQGIDLDVQQVCVRLTDPIAVTVQPQ